MHLGLVSERLKRPKRTYSYEVEEAITRFLEDCWVDVRPTASPEAAHDLKAELIRDLDPILNIQRR